MCQSMDESQVISEQLAIDKGKLSDSSVYKQYSHISSFLGRSMKSGIESFIIYMWFDKIHKSLWFSVLMFFLLFPRVSKRKRERE